MITSVSHRCLLCIRMRVCVYVFGVDVDVDVDVGLDVGLALVWSELSLRLKREWSAMIYLQIIKTNFRVKQHRTYLGPFNTLTLMLLLSFTNTTRLGRYLQCPTNGEAMNQRQDYYTSVSRYKPLQNMTNYLHDAPIPFSRIYNLCIFILNLPPIFAQLHMYPW